MSELELTTAYLGLELANPLVASAGPLTMKMDSLLGLQEAGVGAVVLASVYEEEIDLDAWLHGHSFEYDHNGFAEATMGYFPPVDSTHSGLERHLAHIQRATEELAIPVIGSLNGSSPGGWTHYAPMIADAGVDALELNVYLVAADIEVSGAEIENRYLQVVEQVRAEVDLPLAVKIGPYFSSPANMCRRLVDAGADGLVLFNRFYQPDINLAELTVEPGLVLSTNAEMRLVTRWMAILRDRIDASLAATTGVWESEDAVKLILAGADVTMMTSALIRNGPAYAASIIHGMRHWFEKRGYASLDEARGSLSQRSSPDPSAFERANYAKALLGYTTT
jgi:dihydroorotate dehydrogenase (fumarate)